MPKHSALCPIRPGDPCSLCQPGADGPQNCGLVYLVMDDPELREAWNHNRRDLMARGRKTQDRTAQDHRSSDDS
ncbi:DUF6767 domain-containing protein [Luteococcus sp. Sow4_B9]|uniref:DUF6767 domain-containing protein n=1 Tax=Luteococcus sp. Sow4_B9 TaxID=3438792 RepID=UPI003F9C503B